MKTAIRIATACVLAWAGSALAQQGGRDGTIAKLTDLQGNVLVSRDAGLASGNEALRLIPGTRVITTANSEVIVEYDDGCRVRLKENERFEVERGKPCALLIASVQPILVAPAAVAGIGPILGPALLGGGTVAILIGSRGGQSVSPN